MSTQRERAENFKCAIKCAPGGTYTDMLGVIASARRGEKVAFAAKKSSAAVLAFAFKTFSAMEPINKAEEVVEKFGTYKHIKISMLVHASNENNEEHCLLLREIVYET